MPKPRWTVDEEWTWLSEKVPAYKKAQEEGRVGNWLSSTTQEFLDRFGTRLEITDIKDGQSQEAAEIEKRNDRKGVSEARSVW
jgi:hypothetical protein